MESDYGIAILLGTRGDLLFHGHYHLGRARCGISGCLSSPGSHDYESDSFQLFAKPISIGAEHGSVHRLLLHPAFQLRRVLLSVRVQWSPAISQPGLFVLGIPVFQSSPVKNLLIRNTENFQAISRIA